MRLFKCSVFSSLVYFAHVLLIVHSQEYQSDFINIDCGIPADSNYTDSYTGLHYVSDSGFIDAGESKTIPPAYRSSSLQQQLVTLRSFPQGTRNCYTLKPVQGRGNRYFIRAWFYYRNYDLKDRLPQFDLYLGVEKWDTIYFNQTTTRVQKEIIHVPTSDYIHVCLVNTGLGTPFISALDLRYFNRSMYTHDFGSLKLFTRVNFGESFGYYRYKDDIYDRYWRSSDYFNSSLLYNSENVTRYFGVYNLPAVVMETAIAPENTSNPLKLEWEPTNKSDQFLIYLHFAEVQKLQTNQSREFNIYLNGNLWYDETITPYDVITLTVESVAPEKPESKYEIVLQKTNTSTLPPIINALELYTVRKFRQPQTDDQDVGSIVDIKSVYKVRKGNWQGDPCAPQAYAWDGVGCSYNDSISPRITSLNLSSSGLSGKISPSISNLTMIISLDLSNNNLSGEIPDFLSQLTFLRKLNLKDNKFTGSVPVDLLSKSESGLLLLWCALLPSHL
nr:PREDICTED: putative leucine-rich repeat receptor-like protein kinase At2g19210 [Daucus carota subsp. sativus]